MTAFAFFVCHQCFEVVIYFEDRNSAVEGACCTIRFICEDTRLSWEDTPLIGVLQGRRERSREDAKTVQTCEDCLLVPV